MIRAGAVCNLGKGCTLRNPINISLGSVYILRCNWTSLMPDLKDLNLKSINQPKWVKKKPSQGESLGDV